MNVSRRGFLGLLAAPLIVKAANIMPVRVMPSDIDLTALLQRAKRIEPFNGYYTMFLHPAQVAALQPDWPYAVVERIPT